VCLCDSRGAARVWVWVWRLCRVVGEASVLFCAPRARTPPPALVFWFPSAELTNWDDYSLTIIDPKPERPQQCVTADPDNTLCQLVGDYTLNLNNLSSKAMFPHIAEKCPSEAPNYIKPANC
jgi:hypothetical protein